MSLLKDIYELGSNARTAAAAIGMGMPFYFVSLYLYRPGLFAGIGANALQDIDTYWIICLSFCMSAVWYAVFNFAAKSFITVMLEYKLLSDNKISNAYPFFFSILILVATIGIAYRYELEYKWVFTFQYGFIGIAAIVGWFWSYRITKGNWAVIYIHKDDLPKFTLYMNATAEQQDGPETNSDESNCTDH